uniref:Ig-like domain-containing protein n=1 Tax=Latimeria chalumnae TaxID=7897 RepID=H3AUL4_LATCH
VWQPPSPLNCAAFYWLKSILYTYICGCKGRTLDSTVKLTDNVILSCVYPGTGSINQVFWSKKANSTKARVAIFNRQYGVSVDKEYDGRLQFRNASSSDLSIVIKKATVKDLGTYYCSVSAFPDGVWQKEIEVVKEVDFNGSRTVNTHIEVDVSHDATFRCQLSSTNKTEQITLERIRETHIDTIALCNLSHGKELGSDYRRRTVLNCTSATESIFIIQNITIEDGGTYRCHFIVNTGNQSFIIDLHINSGILGRHFLLLLMGILGHYL